MLILKHLKTLQHVPIIIQIIVQHTSPHGTSRTYTKRYVASPPHLTADN
jgi:hypothetical protein